jgi:hypothetical protein
MLEKTAVIKNGKSRENVSIGHTRHRMNTNEPLQWNEIRIHNISGDMH